MPPYRLFIRGTDGLTGGLPPTRVATAAVGSLGSGAFASVRHVLVDKRERVEVGMSLPTP